MDKKVKGDSDTDLGYSSEKFENHQISSRKRTIWFVIISVGIIFFIEALILNKILTQFDYTKINYLILLLILLPITTIAAILLFLLHSVFKRKESKQEKSPIVSRDMSNFVNSYLLMDKFFNKNNN
ncbi:MAG: hypothetical protein OXC61_11400 [Flavobacteriaceae bacterium]|nr:hypothetical protein [Flavobacteriaceae bacterium]